MPKLSHWVGRLFAALIGITACGGLAAYALHAAAASLGASSQQIRQINEASRQLLTIVAALGQAEAAARGSLLTGDRDYVGALRTANVQARLALHQLAAVRVDPMLIRDRDVVLSEAVHDALSELDRAIALDQAGQHDAAITIEKTGAGEALRRRADTLAAQMMDELAGQLRAAALAHDRQVSFILGLATSAALGAALVLVTAIVLLTLRRGARQRTQARLLATRDAAQAADQAKSRFLAAVSHDVRQPLHAITLLVAALRRHAGGRELQKIADDIGQAARSMQRVFNSLLDVARLDAGATPFAPRSFALDEVLQRLRVWFAPIAADKGLRLEIAETRLFVWSDPVLLEGMLHNLVANAIAYTRNGSVTACAHREAQTIVIEVRDTGAGIHSDRLDRIFDEFVRGGDARAGAGVGLGLAIVRRHAQLLGADIGVESAFGEGSAFTVRLPYVPGEIASVPPPESEGEPNLAGLRILLLEDDAMVRDATAAEIGSWGAHAHTASSADEAIAIMQRMAPDAPDAAIVDQGIAGGLSGVAVLDRIAARFAVALPAVVVTGVTTAEVREELSDSGHPWLLKPADPAMLRRLLARAIEDARTRPLRAEQIDV